MNTHHTTVNAIVSTAHQLIELRGYNAWSYADVAATVGVRKASIHYHFPGKHDLVRQVVAHYRITTNALLARIDEEILDPYEKLTRYAEAMGLDAQGIPRLALCALLAAETPTLPAAVRTEVEAFCIDHAYWLQGVFEKGSAVGGLRVHQSPAVEAHLFLATLEGAVLLARVHNEGTLYSLMAQRLVATYAVPTH